MSKEKKLSLEEKIKNAYGESAVDACHKIIDSLPILLKAFTQLKEELFPEYSSKEYDAHNHAPSFMEQNETEDQ